MKTILVSVGNLPLGGEFPIRVQSMTNTSTGDIEGTIQQCIRIAKSGADYVRITVPSVKDAEYLKQIRQGLLERGYTFPIIADIHFNPQVAEIAATIVEKVRINPGNFADTKKFQLTEYSEEQYQQELEKVREKFLRLINICKEHKTAIRIGVNHGSLSDRIISRYGDTPVGMAESAMEFLRICVRESFYHVVLSMKASNTIVMVQATRLLVHKMMEENMLFPLHLGVTEAGEGEDGRLKSAAGIGALLADGIGDTIRVSLTEEPENEIPVAKKLVENFTLEKDKDGVAPLLPYPVNPFEFSRRATMQVLNIGNGQVPVVICDFSHAEIHKETFAAAGWFGEKEGWTFSDQSADMVYLAGNVNNLTIPRQKTALVDYRQWLSLKDTGTNIFPLLNAEEYLNSGIKTNGAHFILIQSIELLNRLIEKLKADDLAVLVIEAGFHAQRGMAALLMNQNCTTPVIFKRNYSELQLEDFQLKSAADLGGLFIDGLGDGIWLSGSAKTGIKNINQTAFGILQATRARISKTEFIACPSCGRTNFNIIETFSQIREKTSHLKGLKIGIMGCIVNGLGEMADADYGYVGAGKGKINLYKAKTLVKK
ncbi:MAG: (E)-4-hydroxy-3-methylbut-2-enyl-diphosphate synthase, partial [Bacteroidales bacterium]